MGESKGELIRLGSTRAVELASRKYGFADSSDARLRGNVYLDQLILGKVRDLFRRKEVVDNVIYVDFQRNYWLDLVENQFFLMEAFKDNPDPKINYLEPMTFNADPISIDEYVNRDCPALIQHIARNYSSNVAIQLEKRLERFKKETYRDIKSVK